MTLTDPEALFRCLKTATAGAAFGDQAVGPSPAFQWPTLVIGFRFLYNSRYAGWITSFRCRDP